MKCVICDIIIGKCETRSYVTVYRDGKPLRKLYACVSCQPAFDRLIDSLPTDDSGNPLDVCRAERKALILANDPKRLKKRLQEARSALYRDIKARFGQGRFDFANRRLIGDNGLALQWQTRAMPDKPVAYLNQQTTVGYVNFTTLNDSEN